MARTFAKVQILGNVGSDPDVRRTQKGTLVVNLSVASNEWRSDLQDTEVHWHRITFWGKLAAFVESYIVKGDRVFIEGRLKYSIWEKNGVTMKTATIHATNIIFEDPYNKSKGISVDDIRREKINRSEVER